MTEKTGEGDSFAFAGIVLWRCRKIAGEGRGEERRGCGVKVPRGWAVAGA